MRALEIITGHVIYNLAYTYKFQLKTTLATLQSHRWMEFSKMADNMKELSHSMLTQSKSNTRKAAIRADLDEELEM